MNILLELPPQFEAIMIKTALNGHVSVFLWMNVFISLVLISRCRIAGLHTKYNFYFCKELLNNFPKFLYHLHSLQQCMRIPVVLNPCQLLELLVFHFNHFRGLKRYLNAMLMFISMLSILCVCAY